MLPKDIWDLVVACLTEFRGNRPQPEAAVRRLTRVIDLMRQTCDEHGSLSEKRFDQLTERLNLDPSKPLTCRGVANAERDLKHKARLASC